MRWIENGHGKVSADDKGTTGQINRRSFCAVAAATPLSLLTSRRGGAEEPPVIREDQERLETGNGEWHYHVEKGWGHLPAGMAYGGTHGAIATDSAGLVYVSTQSETGILVYDAKGRLLRTIAKDYPEVHSIFYSRESGVEYFYTTVQKGTPQENWLFVKMKTDGTVVMKITAPEEAGFKSANEWRVTAAVPAPDGSIFIANGYGDSRIFRFDRRGKYLDTFGGKGSSDGMFDCSHGLAVDARYDQPLLLVCDRENRRLCHFDFDGKFVRNLTQHLRRPCQVSFHQDHAVVSELEGRVVVLDRDNAPVAFLGDNPDRSQWANYSLKPHQIASPLFSAAHGCHVDASGDLYISDWNQTGRVTKLSRIRL